LSIRRAALTAVALGGLWWWWRRPFRVLVAGESMTPELLPGDCLVAVRSRSFRRGALVVIEHPDRPGFEVVKRLDGLPGDSVYGHRLGHDEYWVVGDNARLSTDSRAFGPVSLRRIRGVIEARYWPPDRVRVFR
jgi:signal peptidase I